MKTNYLAILFIAFISCKKSPQHLTKITGENIRIDTTIKASKTIKAIISPYKVKLEADMKEVLCIAQDNLNKSDGNLQSSLGNIMADLCVEQGNTVYHKITQKNIDFAMLNNGGIRAIISKGNVTTESAFKLMPFENELVVVTLSGEKIEALVNYFIAEKKAHPLSKQIKLTLDGEKYNLEINGEKFDKKKTYNVVTSDYLQNGGDNMVFFKNPIALKKLNYKLRDAIIDYFKKSDTLKTKIDNRVIIK